MRPCQFSFACHFLHPNSCTDCPLQGLPPREKQVFSQPCQQIIQEPALHVLTGFPQAPSLQPKCSCGGKSGYWYHTLGTFKVCQPTSDSKKIPRRHRAFFIALLLPYPAKLLWVRNSAIPSRFLKKDEKHSKDQHWLKMK